MTDYYVDDGAGGLNDGTSWTDAYTSITSVPSLSSNDRVFIKHDHNETITAGSDFIFTGPASSPPAVVYSASGTGTVYQVASNAQVSTVNTGDRIEFDGSFVFYGINVSSGGDVFFEPDQTESLWAYFCTFECATASSATQARFYVNSSGAPYFWDCTFNRALDTASGSRSYFEGGNTCRLTAENCAFNATTPANNIGNFFSVSNGGPEPLMLKGCDLSSLTSLNEVWDTSYDWKATIDGCQLPSGVTLFGTALDRASEGMSFAFRSDDTSYGVEGLDDIGSITQSTANVRTGGATDGTSYSLLITTETGASDYEFVTTPWCGVWVDSTGSATVDMFINSDDSGHTDSEIWMEVEYLAADNVTSYESTRNADPLAAGDALTSDTSTWTTNNNRYKLSKDITIGTKGYVRARLCVAVDITDNLYVDPEISIS